VSISTPISSVEDRRHRDGGACCCRLFW